jgi:(2R)-3-sulfolactate dehydrogenase (NADP+)
MPRSSAPPFIAGDLVSPSRIVDYASLILTDAGMIDRDARRMAEVLVFAQESGIDSHGIMHLPAYVEAIASGAVNPRPAFAIEGSVRSAATIDADRGPGALAGLVACDEAINRARECGTAVVAVRNSGHFGTASAFADRIAAAGMICLIFSNASPTVAPRGAATALFGTNPIAAGFPRAGAGPVLIDFATTSGSRGKIREAAAAGKPIPADWALDRSGRPTTDATAALSGTMQALGGEKGTLLPLMVELLCVALSGGAPGADVLTPQDPSGNPRNVSHLFIAIDSAAFGGIEAVGQRVAEIATMVEDATPAIPGRPPRMPGARGAAQRADSRRNGIRISAPLVTALQKAADAAAALGNPSTQARVSLS